MSNEYIDRGITKRSWQSRSPLQADRAANTAAVLMNLSVYRANALRNHSFAINSAVLNCEVVPGLYNTRTPMRAERQSISRGVSVGEEI